MISDGELVADGSYFRLSSRLLDRQQRQDEGLRPATRAWRGGWELAIGAPAVRSPSERAALGSDLVKLRLSELRPGVWVRPDNLLREWPADVVRRAWRFESRSIFDQTAAAELAAELWDLAGWSRQAEGLLNVLESTGELAQRFALAAAMVRHLPHAPLLPPSLLPGGWPGPRLRGAYSAFRREFAELLREEQVGQD